MPQAICPHCLAEIDSLDYRSEVSEFGTCGFEGEEQDCHDSDCNEILYYCPECGDELDIEETNFYPNEENENNEETKPPTSEPLNRIINDSNYSYGLKFIICPNCNQKTEMINSNEEIECSSCKITIDINKAKIINI